MTTAQEEVARIRAKIAALKPEDRCNPHCPTWAVFECSGSRRVFDGHLELESCIDCWHRVTDPLTDEEIDLLPEAQAELQLARAHYETYRHPFADAPCACGSVLRRPCSTGEPDSYCVNCGDVRHYKV